MVRTSEVGGRMVRLKFRAVCMYFTETDFIVGLSCKFSWKYVSQFWCFSCWQLRGTKKRSEYVFFQWIRYLKKSFAYCHVVGHSLKGLIRIRFSVTFVSVRYVTLRYVPLRAVMWASLVMHWSECKKIENCDESWRVLIPNLNLLHALTSEC
jgi:hypothetical protein